MILKTTSFKMPEWENRYKSIETVVGGGFYALRKTKYGSKLVMADRSPLVRKDDSIKGDLRTEPLVGKRYDRPLIHRARTQKL